MANITSNPFLTKRQRWLAMLNFYQAKSGALTHNNPTEGNSLREIMVKLLRSIQGI